MWVFAKSHVGLATFCHTRPQPRTHAVGGCAMLVGIAPISTRNCSAHGMVQEVVFTYPKVSCSMVSWPMHVSEQYARPSAFGNVVPRNDTIVGVLKSYLGRLSVLEVQ